MFKNNLLVILGPTASGKTSLATEIAYHFNGEIISADSRQVFRGMDIGTGKDLAEYNKNNTQIPYYLIDIKEAGEKYHVNAFKQDFYQAFDLISSKNKLPILCGGTGMYIHSVLQNQEFTAVPVNEKLREELHNLSKVELIGKLGLFPEKLTKHVDLSSHKRLIRAIEIATFFKSNTLKKEDKPNTQPFIIGLQSDVEIRRAKILKRLDFRLKNGLIEEVEQLLKNKVPAEILDFYGLEYKFVNAYLANQINLVELKEKLGIAICQYAKRQMTFFRKMEKDGLKINWLTTDIEDSLLKEKAFTLIDREFQLK
jgi:tRNA dimethylallyltransferase